MKLVRMVALMIDDRYQAEEVVQDAFAQPFSRWPTIDPAKAMGYLYRPVTIDSHSALRRRRIVRFSPPRDVPKVDPD